MKNESKNKIDEIIRVDHAGELGARVIYNGQILALKIKKDFRTLEIVKKMRDQELKHLHYFSQKIIDHKVRPTLMEPIWKIGGFALGFVSAIIDKKSAMTCTTAVEETIDHHYQQQIAELESIKINLDSNSSKYIFKQHKEDNEIVNNLIENIEKFRQEEVDHRDIAYNEDAKDFIMHQPFNNIIKFVTRLAISISKRV